MALLAAAAYPLLGILFAAGDALTPGRAGSVAWRLAAWVASGCVFLLHLRYELFVRDTAPLRAAARVAGSVALGALLLAVWIVGRGLWTGSLRQSPRAPLALLLFPLVSGVPALLVAAGIGFAQRWLRNRRG
jgi:hypothetical protein